MDSLKLTNGDLEFDNLGKIVFINSKERLIQKVLLKIQTLKTELFYNTNYGLSVLKGKVTKELLEINLKDAIIDDEDFINLEITSFIQNADSKNSYDIEMIIYLSDNSILEINYQL